MSEPLTKLERVSLALLIPTKTHEGDEPKYVSDMVKQAVSTAKMLLEECAANEPQRALNPTHLYPSIRTVVIPSVPSVVKE